MLDLVGQHKRGGQFACITYHRIGSESDQYTVSESQFRAQLRLLREEGYIVEDFAQLELRLRSSSKFPNRYVIATVDDGLECCMTAAELLQSFGCGATFFVTRDRSVSKPGYIRADQIRQLRKSGFSLGTHGTTHRKLTHLPPSCCREELEDSKRWLEDVLADPIRYMAAPGGYISPSVAALARQAGYVLLGTCREWVNSEEMLRLPALVNRVNIRRYFSEREFRQAIAGELQFYLPRQLRSAILWLPKQLLPA